MLEMENSTDMYFFCKWLIEAVEKYFENPEVQKRFEEWQQEENKRKEANK